MSEPGAIALVLDDDEGRFTPTRRIVIREADTDQVVYDGPFLPWPWRT